MNSGFDAHLELDSHGGQVWVSLRVRIGHAPKPLQPPDHFPPHQNRTRDGQSRQCRRARRAAARAEQHVDKESEVEAEEAAFANPSTVIACAEQICLH